MKRYTVNLFFIFGSLFATLLIFQNCSSNFKSAENNSENTDVSLAAPDIVFGSMPDLISSSSIQFTFLITGTAESITCSLNLEAPKDCSSRAVTYNNLTDGDYAFDVTVSSTEGSNVRRHIFRKDGTAPSINVTLVPPASTSLTTAAFVFSVLDNLSGVSRIQCSLDNAAFSNCTSPVNLSALAVAAHNFRIQATDLAGNVTPVFTYNWAVTSPGGVSVVLSSAPPSLTNSTTANFVFTGVNAVSYECSRDSSAFASCVSPYAASNLSVGSHNFRVRAVSANGTRSSEAIVNWVLDLVLPTAPNLSANVTASTNQTSATFNFSSTDANGIARYECSLDNAAFVTCTSPRAVSSLTVGSHNFRTRAVDNAGNFSQISQMIWIVDTSNPVLALTQTPASSTSATTAIFAFSASDAGSGIAQVQCSLNNVAFSNCTSPINLTGLSVRAHNFRIQARDNAGNTSLVSYNWTVTSSTPPTGNTQTVAGTLRWRSGFENGVPGEWLNYINNYFSHGNITGALGWTLVTPTAGPVYSGNYAFKGSVLGFYGQNGGVRRAYPLLNTNIPTPMVNTFMVYLDVDYNVMTTYNDWISIATYTNHPDIINWPDIHSISIVNRRLELGHMESPGFSGQYVGPAPQPEFPTRRWVRITTYIQYESSGRGRVDVWQDGVRVLTGIQQSTTNGTTMTAGHWGLYTNDATWQAHLYNDDISIWSLNQPLTDFVREPVVQP